MTPRPARPAIGLALATTLAMGGALAAPAGAAQPSQPETLTCADGQQLVLDVLQGNAFKVPDSTRTFVVVSAFAVVDGVSTVIQRPNGTQRSRDLRTCSFTASPGRVVTVTGFFTPAD